MVRAANVELDDVRSSEVVDPLNLSLFILVSILLDQVLVQLTMQRIRKGLVLQSHLLVILKDLLVQSLKQKQYP